MTQTNGNSHVLLRGKVYAITGGASGIGWATSQILSRRGATVCIADIDPEAIESAEKYLGNLGAPHMLTRVDVSKRAQVDDWVSSIVEKYGRLDGAANVAGVIGKGHGIASVAELDDEEWDKIIGVNLTGTMYCLRAELRNVVDGGSIVNVSSIHGLKGKSFTQPMPTTWALLASPVLANWLLGFARHAAYDASKHGMVGLTKAAALENGEREIRVNSVAPGAIYTPLMQKNWDFVGRPKDAPFDDPSAFKRQGTAEETANVIAFLLGPESTFVSGSVYQVDGAWI
jgi:NAD(P)-dependent dehydrogenase (short-subunit alcohol dehydrogenase family)